MKIILLFIRKVVLVLSGTLLSNKVSYFFIGKINKFILDNRIYSIFLLYPANQKYVEAYCFGWYAKLMKWTPKLIGAYTQNGAMGLIFGISATDLDFYDNKNLKNLKLLEERFEKIKRLVGAKQKTYAGTLPGIMVKDSIIHESVEAQTTVNAVTQAIEKVISNEKLPPDPGIIVLGGDGFIGKKLIEKISKKYKNIFSIDLKRPTSIENWPQEGRFKRLIIVNITKRGAIKNYFSKMKKGMIFLNEVYPEPTREEIEKMRKIGIKCFHVVGVKGFAWPSFPKAYAGGIPCCASIGEQHLHGQKINVIVHEKGICT